MSPPDTRLELTTTVNNDRAVSAAPLGALSRDVQISIEYDAALHQYDVRAWGDTTFPPNGRQYRGTLDLDATDLYGAVSAYREVWQQKIIDLRILTPDRVRLPFQDGWNLSTPEDKQRLRDAGLTLARAGNDLFNLLFGRGDDGLKEIGALLSGALRRHECVITIHSADCFVPWQMLYTHPEEAEDLERDDAVWRMDGFWGYRHLVEQQLPLRPIGVAIAVDPKLQVGLNFDRQIDVDFDTPFTKSIDDFFSGRAGIVKQVRESKETLRRAIESDHYSDHISYFGCHGSVSTSSNEQPHFKLTDRVPIRRSDLLTWFTSHPIRSSPVVFVNACEGGQMSSLFYNSFSEVLLSSGANCLIGAQTDLPAIFAAEFARRFFEAFLAANDRVGEILRRLVRQFADDYCNPLGLVYSLYHGLDTHLTKPVD